MEQTKCPYRPELVKTAMPPRIAKLPVDDRGYPVPWFVDYVDGKPEFRAMDPFKWKRAVREKLCWVCGERMGRYMTFVAGPMCGINRTSAEPPTHRECAEWSALHCPFLNNPDSIRRVDEVVGLGSDNVPGHMITRNPGVTMLWTCVDYSIFGDGRGHPLIMFGEPVAVDWYTKGKVATRAEVVESIASGIHNLVEAAKREEGGLKYLDEARARFERYLPKCSSI